MEIENKLKEMQDKSMVDLLIAYSKQYGYSEILKLWRTADKQINELENGTYLENE